MDHYALMGDGRMIDGELYEEQRGTDDYLKEHPEYQRYDFISEGDTPSFLYLIDRGLRSIEHPSYGGWGSRFTEDKHGIYRNTALDYNPYTKQYEAQYSLSRWFTDIQNDFAARIEWGLTDDDTAISHYPAFSMDQPVDLTVFPGQTLMLSCTTAAHVSWFHYFECDVRKNRTPLQHEKIMAGDLQIDEIAEGIKDDIPLYEADAHKISILIPEDLQAGDTIHIITEITSADPIPLKRYARTILTVT